MPNLKVNLRPVHDQVSKKLKKQAEFIEQNVVSQINAKVFELAEQFAQQVEEKVIKPKVPRKSGALRDSIRVVVDRRSRKNLTFKIYAGSPDKPLPYAVFLEYGTAKHTIKHKKSFHFIGKSAKKQQPKYAKKVHYNLKGKGQDVWVSGPKRKGPAITVKGIKARYFLRSGVTYIRQVFPKVLAAGVVSTKLYPLRKTTKYNMYKAVKPKARSMKSFQMDPSDFSTGKSKRDPIDLKWDFN